MRLILTVTALIVFQLVAAIPADAGRIHVSINGLRQEGLSEPGDWSLENCYPTLAAGLAAASLADTLLLAPGDHVLTSSEILPALFAGHDLGHDPQAHRVLLGPGGSVLVAGAAQETEVRGIGFSAGDPGTDQPAVRILPPEGGAGSVLIETCDFAGLSGGGDWASGGAAIHAVAGSMRLTIEVRQCRFLDSSAPAQGGAIYAEGGLDLQITGSVFERNESRHVHAATFGGAIAVIGDTSGTAVGIDACLIADSVSWGPGGGVYVQDAHLTMRDTEVRGSRSAFGGATYWSAGAGVFLRRVGDDPEPIQLVAERCRFLDNRGDQSAGIGAGDGGGLMIRGSDEGSPVEATIIDCVFAGNFNDQGGGLYVGRGATGTIERTLFLNNTARSNGGGAYKGGALSSNIGETALFIYCVFAGNRAGWDQDGQLLSDRGWGGAFKTRRYPRAEFHNCTFADNLSGVAVGRGDAFYNHADGGSFYHSLMRSRLVNCLFYGAEGNDVQVRSDLNGFTEVLNCAWEAGEFVVTGGSYTPAVLLDGSPFAPGGGWDLAADSACIDAGADLGYTTDFAGAPVPAGAAPDIGALEYLIPVGVADLPDGADPVRSLALLPARPNPANPRTEVAFALQRPASARLTVHDLAGRLIAVLHDGPLPAGEHRAGWAGRRADGGVLPSGVYLVRLAAGGAVATQKVMLVR